jgi:hypothetical protein
MNTIPVFFGTQQMPGPNLKAIQNQLLFMLLKKVKKSKAILVTGRGGL